MVLRLILTLLFTHFWMTNIRYEDGSRKTNYTACAITWLKPGRGSALAKAIFSTMHHCTFTFTKRFDMFHRHVHISARKSRHFRVLSHWNHGQHHGQQIPALPERVHKRDISSCELQRYAVQSLALSRTGLVRNSSRKLSATWQSSSALTCHLYSNSTFHPQSAF
jgi:hypothetical protein